MITASLPLLLLLFLFAARFSRPFVAIYQPAPSCSRRTNTYGREGYLLVRNCRVVSEYVLIEN